MIPDIRKHIAMFEGSQTSPACPFNKNSITFKMNMQYWLTDIDREDRSTRKKTCRNIILSTINITRPGPRSIPGLRGDKPGLKFWFIARPSWNEISLHKF
jgi:hypothetical protein